MIYYTNVDNFPFMSEKERLQCIGIGNFIAEPPFEVFAGLVPSKTIYESYRLSLYLPGFLDNYRNQLQKLDVNIIGKILDNRIILYESNSLTSLWLSVFIKWLRKAGFDIVNYKNCLDTGCDKNECK